ncbi:hypothetical protein LIA77_03966 [Sarocladium implicatum]|nr:hypothetical protein LIA77_03966 [Sarocladium implicatum]
MAEATQAPSGSEPTLADRVLALGKIAFDPSQDDLSRKERIDEFEGFIAKSSTVALIPALNALIKPNASPPWLRDHIMRTLTHLPLRRHGVRATMEFVFSVHPTNVERMLDAGGPQKQGANITHEAVAVATKLLSSVPADMSPEEWFNGISGQFFGLIDGDAGPDVSKTAAQIVGFGILGKRQFGAPGAAGWNAFVHPLLADLNPSLRLSSGGVKQEAVDEDGVIDMSLAHVLTTNQSLQRSLKRLKILVLSSPAPGLCRRLLTPIMHQLWTLASWPDPSPAQNDTVCQPALLLFQTFLKLFGTRDVIMPIMKDLDSQGSIFTAKPAWIFRTNVQREIQATLLPDTTSQIPIEWPVIDSKASTLVESLATMCPPEEVSSIFLDLLQRWIQSQEDVQGIKIAASTLLDDSRSAIRSLIDVTILQKLMEKAPEKLVSRFEQLLELVYQVLVSDERSQLGDDIMAVVLSLLNLILGAPSFRKSDISSEKLEVMDKSLARLGQQDRPSVAPTAKNLQMLLSFRSEIDEMEEKEQPRLHMDSQTLEDRRTYALAMEYITAGDNPPPVISEGLDLLTKLISSGSRVLDITSVLVLMSNLLTNNEDFINLRVIRIFTIIANKHPKATIEEISDHYLDAHERASTDVRLRFGEAFVQVIEKLGETFTGDVARQACERILSIAGRRGYRPKTLARQARDERMRQLKKAKGKNEDMDMDDLEEEQEMTEEEKANNDILSQIVSGWESKRGSEDVRMRSSALSIFSAGLETNISGVGASMTSTAMDLCINVLTLEPEPEKGILRRAAVTTLMSFVRALSAARESGRRLGFGLTEESRKDMVVSLQYIAATDNDGLVREQAEDVSESLDNWALSSMMPTNAASSANLEPPGLSRLAGLSVNPGGSSAVGSGRDQPRPRIEEIE